MVNNRLSPGAEKAQKEQPSEREIDILKAMARGYTSKEIAEQLFISENTVEAHRKRLFHKLGARNVANLIYKAIEQGYIKVKKSPYGMRRVEFAIPKDQIHRQGASARVPHFCGRKTTFLQRPKQLHTRFICVS